MLSNIIAKPAFTSNKIYFTFCQATLAFLQKSPKQREKQPCNKLFESFVGGQSKKRQYKILIQILTRKKLVATVGSIERVLIFCKKIGASEIMLAPTWSR